METVTQGWHDVPTVDGVLFADLQTILLRRGLLQVQRRCTLAHELAHHHLEHNGCADRRSLRRQELEAEIVASRWLIPLDAYIRARLWSRHEEEQAEELWVDVPILRARADSLTRAERTLVQDRVRAAQEWGAA
jgi:Zn-dependent peptidase ImmA (M78 family)